MRRLVITLFTLITICMLPAGAVSPKHHTAGPRKQTHRTHRRPNAKWDPGYTYNNPYGMPRCVKPKCP
jgi:hypothetical protein